MARVDERIPSGRGTRACGLFRNIRYQRFIGGTEVVLRSRFSAVARTLCSQMLSFAGDRYTVVA